MRRVLVVDDDPNVTEGIRLNLRTRYEVVAAASGAEALDKCETDGPFPVLVTDLRMPGMDGIELLERVRNKFPETIRIMLSGTVDMAATVRAVNDGGVQHVLIKPTEPKTLERAIAAAFAAYDEKEKERSLALVDPMLQVGSRRAFEQSAVRIHSHASRHGRTFAVVMIDVDYFKRYNDSYGHVAGDEALRRVAAAIHEAIRTSDELFRYGGEELVIILPDLDFDGLDTVIERCRVTVTNLKIPHAQNDSGQVTISLGAAISAPENRPTFQAIIERADQALYWSKRNGRNRTKIWDESLGCAR